MSNIRDKIVLGIITFMLMALVSGSVIFLVRTLQNKPLEISIIPLNPPGYTYEVNISGAVVNPGIFRAKDNDTILTLINTAVLSPEADINSIRIYVPPKTGSSYPQKVNINTAEEWLLLALPDLGPEKVRDIISYRQQNGPFRSIYDLQKVEGIGNYTIEKIKSFISVGE
jgi:competence protein ComEA